MRNYNEENVPGFTLPGTTTSTPEGDFGKFSSAMGPYSPQEGRLGGGGWVDDPMAHSIKDDGIWAESPAADDEIFYDKINVPEGYNGGGMGLEDRDMILEKVMGWDDKYLTSRRVVGEPL